MPELGISVDQTNEYSSSQDPHPSLGSPEVSIPHPFLHPIWRLQLIRPSVDHGNNDPAKVKDCPIVLAYSLGSEKAPKLFSYLSKNVLQLLYQIRWELLSAPYYIFPFIKPSLPVPSPSSSFFLLSLLLLPPCSVSSSIHLFSKLIKHWPLQPIVSQIDHLSSIIDLSESLRRWE